MNIDIEMYMNYPVEHYNHLENYQQIVQKIVKYKHKHKFEFQTNKKCYFVNIFIEDNDERRIEISSN